MSALDDEMDVIDVDAALAAFARAARTHYGERLVRLALFGSRARGDHRPDSDADVAVILVGDDWSFWAEKAELAALAYDMLIEYGLQIQGWPVSEQEWRDPARHWNARFLQQAKREALPFPEAA